MTQAKILIVDDEADILEMLRYNLEHEGFLVQTAKNGAEALEQVQSFLPHLIILDIMMPGMDGIEVCEKLRSDSNLDTTLIAFLTARSESFTHVSALETGGDDFITKPIKPSVLKSRIRALLRRHPNLLKTASDKIEEYGKLTINFDEYTVTLGDEAITLPRKEFELLQLLVSKPGKVFRRTEILTKVWGNSVIVGDRTIDVHIRKLREKIGSQYIQTLKGVGYKFDF